MANPNSLFLTLIIGGGLFFIGDLMSTGSKTDVTADNVTQVSAFDPDMNAAIADAQSTIDLFLAAAKTGETQWDDVYLKVGLQTPDDSKEHIWVVNYDQGGNGTFSAELSNEPVNLPGLSHGSVVTFSKDMISDWAFIENGTGYGYYTLRAIVPTMSPEDANAMAAFLSPDPVPADWK